MGDRDNLPELPQGWVYTSLEAVSEKIIDCLHSTPKFLTKGKYCIDTTCIEPGKIVFEKVRYVSTETYHERTKRLVPQSGDILFSREGTIGTAIVVPDNIELCLGQRMMMFRPSACIISTYYMWALTSPILKNQWKSKVTGTTSPHVNIRDLRLMVLPLAPLAEQHRIVAKIEELVSELDAGVELLKKLKAKLKRYRQAVLKAAVEGKLTKDWRETHQGELEPASVLLERILKERREKWEAEQLAQMKAKGKTPKDDSWKLKYKEPVAPDTSDLFKLPEGWEWISLDYVLSKIEAGKSFNCEERTPTVEEVGVVKVSAVTWGEFNEFESKTCLDLDRINPQLFVKEGDFLFSRANTIELVGACVIAKHVTRRVMLSDKILRFHFVEVPSKWILFALRTRLGRNEIERLSTGNQESMRNIGQERIRRIRISLPPVQEIQQIVSELERRFSVTDELEKVIEQNLKRAEKLRQSILKKAFEGKLVPQDPTDEPADKLLERIKAEKAKREAETKAKKKRKQPGKSQQLELF
jgi:type I restriction enzyme S subunit